MSDTSREDDRRDWRDKSAVEEMRVINLSTTKDTSGSGSVGGGGHCFCFLGTMVKKEPMFPFFRFCLHFSLCLLKLFVLFAIPGRFEKSSLQ